MSQGEDDLNVDVHDIMEMRKEKDEGIQSQTNSSSYKFVIYFMTRLESCTIMEQHAPNYFKHWLIGKV